MRGGPAIGRGRERSTTSVATAVIAAIGPGRVTLANGSDAIASTIATMIRSETQPGAARTLPTSGGAPASTRKPPSIATSPAAIAGATSGTTARLTSGDRMASRPNEASTIGSVAACAASDTPRLSASQPGTWPRPTRSIQPVSGVAHAIRPAVASAESWKPASRMSAGSATSRITAAHASAAAARPARPDSRARRTTPAIAPARTTDADAPAKAT